RSCNRGAGARSPWRAVCRSSRRTRNSCPLRQDASLDRELWPRTGGRFLPPAGCAARADWASDFRRACRGTERKARGGTESRYAYSALEGACRCAGKTEHRPNANCRLPASWQRRSRFLNLAGHRSLRDRLEDSVRKAECQDVLNGFFAEIVVDAVDLFLAGYAQELLIEGLGGFQVVPERLFNNDAPPVLAIFLH